MNGQPHSKPGIGLLHRCSIDLIGLLHINQSKKPEFHPLQILFMHVYAMFLALKTKIFHPVVNSEAHCRISKVPSIELTFTYTHVDHDEVSNTLEYWSVMIHSLAVLLGPITMAGSKKQWNSRTEFLKQC